MNKGTQREKQDNEKMREGESRCCQLLTNHDKARDRQKKASKRRGERRRGVKEMAELSESVKLSVIQLVGG